MECTTNERRVRKKNIRKENIYKCDILNIKFLAPISITNTYYYVDNGKHALKISIIFSCNLLVYLKFQ